MSTNRSTHSAYAPLSGGEEAIATPLGSSSNSNNKNGSVGFLEQFFGPQKGRENHLYFGCCCDTRRAVMILNMITIIFKSIAIIWIFVFVRTDEENHRNDMQEPSSAEYYNYTYDANVVVADEEDIKAGLLVLEGLFDIIMLFSMFLHAFGVYGALEYKTWAIKVAAVAYGVPFTWAVLNFAPVTFIIGGIFLYPHIVLIKEIESGVMSSYNYENVRACCVC